VKALPLSASTGPSFISCQIVLQWRCALWLLGAIRLLRLKYFAQDKKNGLGIFLELPNGIPSQDTFECLKGRSTG
jgi:hypothetical protein